MRLRHDFNRLLSRIADLRRAFTAPTAINWSLRTLAGHFPLAFTFLRAKSGGTSPLNASKPAIKCCNTLCKAALCQSPSRSSSALSSPSKTSMMYALVIMGPQTRMFSASCLVKANHTHPFHVPAAPNVPAQALADTFR